MYDVIYKKASLRVEHMVYLDDALAGRREDRPCPQSQLRSENKCRDRGRPQRRRPSGFPEEPGREEWPTQQTGE